MMLMVACSPEGGVSFEMKVGGKGIPERDKHEQRQRGETQHSEYRKL